MPNIITQLRFKEFHEAIRIFLADRNIIWAVDKRHIDLSEQFRSVKIRFESALLIPHDVKRFQMVDYIGELAEIIGNLNGSLQTPQGIVVRAYSDERWALDAIITYIEIKLSDRQIAEFKEKRFV